MKNSEIVKEILNVMEREHLNLYHDVTKEEVLNYINSNKNIDNLNKIEFDSFMLKLFALFKDAHTTYFIPYKEMNREFTYVKGIFYIKINDNYYKVLKICDKNIKEIIKEIIPMLNYETDEWKNICIRRLLKNEYCYEMLGLTSDEKVKIEYEKDDGSIEIEILHCVSEEEYIKMINKDLRPYYFKIFDNNILYFRYYRCREVKEYPFITFLEDMKREIDRLNIKDYILDVRENSGGDSKVINPFKEYLKNNKMNGVVLMDNGTFSSGRFAVAQFKDLFNCTLIGEAIGSPVKAYGNTKILHVDGFGFTVSTNLWDFSSVFENEKIIKPNIEVINTIENTKNKKDIQLETAINYILNMRNNKKLL